MHLLIPLYKKRSPCRFKSPAALRALATRRFVRTIHSHECVCGSSLLRRRALLLVAKSFRASTNASCVDAVRGARIAVCGMDPPQCDPPESLLLHEAPLFVGFEHAREGSYAAKKGDPSASPLEEMVNAMLPPREWTQESGTWMQYVSKRTATRMDVIQLQEHLDKRLLELQAREAGICAVREDLYSQSFDELIRQITLDGPERGLLLLRTRDEIRMTIDAYKTLYDSSVTFGIRKQLQAEQGMSDLEERIGALEGQNKDLENNVLELRNGVEVIEKRENEHKAVQDKKRKDEIDFLKYQGQHLDAFLRQLGPAK